MAVGEVVRRWRLPRGTVGRVTAVTALFYLLFTVAALVRAGGDVNWFIWIGSRFAEGDPQGNLGYDGQFVFYIARDWLAAAPLLDLPAYRLQRILLPALARGVAFGRTGAIPWAILVINFTALVASAVMLARYLKRRHTSPWYALAYVLYVGTFMAYSRAVTEPLAYALALGGMLLWLERRQPWAIAAFALAGLAKEQAILVPIAVGCATLLRHEWRRAIALFLVPLPLVLWEWFLFTRFGTIGLGEGSSTQWVPLLGLIQVFTPEAGRITGLLAVALPAVVLFGAALWLLRRDAGQAGAWLLLWHALFALLLPTDVYDHVMHAGRNAAGLALAVALCAPLVPPRLTQGLTVWWIGATLVWLVPVLRFAPWTQ